MKPYEKRIPVSIDKRKLTEKKLSSIEQKLQNINTPIIKMVPKEFKVPEIQKVEIVNPPQSKEVQKVEVINQKDKDIQKVEVVNPIKTKDIQKVEIVNQEKSKEIEFPEVQKVEIVNKEKITFPKVQKVETGLPIGKGNIPKQADPSIYIPVRLTDGNKFYKSLDEFYVSASKGGGITGILTVKIKDLVPTDPLKYNPKVTTTISGNITYITEEFNGLAYQKTVTVVSGNTINSAWIQL